MKTFFLYVSVITIIFLTGCSASRRTTKPEAPVSAQIDEQWRIHQSELRAFRQRRGPACPGV